MVGRGFIVGLGWLERYLRQHDDDEVCMFMLG